MGSYCNVTSAKMVLTEVSPIPPRIATGRLTTPTQIVPEHACQLEGVDEAIVSLHAKRSAARQALVPGQKPAASAEMCFGTLPDRQTYGFVRSHTRQLCAVIA